MGVTATMMVDGNASGDAMGVLLSNFCHQSKNVALVDACMATSAAPTYFDPHTFSYKVDGDDKDSVTVTCYDGGLT